MTTLDEVMQMKKQGKTDNEIIKALKEKGITPKEINDALDQSRIKNAVSNEKEKFQERNEDIYNPQPQEETQEYYPQEQQETYFPQEEYYPQEQYDSYSSGVDTDTIIEIAEQIFLEKIKTIQKQMDILNEFKNLSQSRIENINERLKRIELTIDKLQSAILEKIGEYGNNLQSIKNEMQMMQDTFGKSINQLADKTSQIQNYQKPPLNNTPSTQIKNPKVKKRASSKKTN